MSDKSLWLDTNVAWSPPKVRKLGELARQKGVQVFVHAQIHLEIWRQRHIKDGEDFLADLIWDFLQQLGIKVFDVVLDQATAERWGERLAQRYPDDDWQMSRKIAGKAKHPKDMAWKTAKLSSVRAQLPEQASISVHDVPMTTDWLVALAVEDYAGYIAVEDKGAEWDALRDAGRALTFEESLAWLQDLPDAPAAPASARP